MKKRILSAGTIVAVSAILVSCGGETAPKTEQRTIMKIDNTLTEMEKSAGVLTPEVMWKMRRVGVPTIAASGGYVTFPVTDYSMSENKGQTSIYNVKIGGGDPQKQWVSDKFGSVHDYSVHTNGSTYFVAEREGAQQLMYIPSRKMDVEVVTNIEGGIEAYGVSPKGDKLFYVKRVQVEKRESSAVYPELNKSKALVYDELMERHWNYWDRGSYLHIFVADLSGGIMSGEKDIMEGEAWDAPMAPYFDASEITWNNSGTQLAYTSKKLVGKDYANSTNSDVYLYDLESGTTQNLTEGMPGYDKYPVFSPDDTHLAFISMARDGNESDKERLYVTNLETGERKYLTQNFDYNASNVTWDSNYMLYFISPIEATHQICRVPKAGGQVEVITKGDHDIVSLSLTNDAMVVGLQTISMATELFKVDKNSGALKQITFMNQHIYDHIKMGEVEKRWIRTTDYKQMLTWVVTPPDFDPAKTYPVLLFCNGGPQSVVSQFWSYRWNFQLMAAQGYIVVAPNRRGLPSFGQEWLDQISGDYSGQNMRDYISAIDNVAREPWADQNHMGCVGASYGGFSVYYLAGHHYKRFKAFIAHCGMFNLESFYGSTEELFFPNNDLGGPYWERGNWVAQRSYANSPHRFVDRWDTPMLIITGLNDFRIPYTESLQAFTAAQQKGLPSRLVAFEDEAHQVFKPQNSIVWNREFFDWLDKYVKTAE